MKFSPTKHRIKKARNLNKHYLLQHQIKKSGIRRLRFVIIKNHFRTPKPFPYPQNHFRTSKNHFCTPKSQPPDATLKEEIKVFIFQPPDATSHQYFN